MDVVDERTSQSRTTFLQYLYGGVDGFLLVLLQSAPPGFELMRVFD
jgi:hypothetical protein